MNNNLVRNIIGFTGVLVIQILFLTNFAPGMGIHVMIYPMLIIALPFDLKPIWIMLIALVLGFTVDAFNNTFGLHASSAVFIAYLRPILMKFIAPKDGYDPLLRPNIKDMGFKWYAAILIILTALHHLWFFVFESFNLYDFGYILLKVLLSTIVSWFLSILLQLLFAKSSKTIS